MSKSKEEYTPEDIIRMSVMEPEFFKLHLEKKREKEKNERETIQEKETESRPPRPH